MPNCEICGTAIPYPFRCNYCGGLFCAEHRLPEAHSCLRLPSLSNTDIDKNGDETEETERESIDTITTTDLPMTEDESPPSTEKGASEETLPSMNVRIPKGRSRIVVALCILLIAMPTVAGYLSYGVGYDSGFKSNSVSSYNAGYNSGNASGFTQGDASGYNRGYGIGYGDGNASGYVGGYDVGYTKGVNDGAGHGFTIRDPTYQEMLNFIASDQTDKNQYNSTYVCWNFAADVKNNAFNVGYRCGSIYIEFADSAHAIVSFKTVDRGLVFVEPQDDSIVSLVIGQHYWDRTKYTVTYNDTVVSYVIIW